MGGHVGDTPLSAKQRYLFIVLALPSVLFAGAADVARAQTQPELRFLNGALTMRAKHDRLTLTGPYSHVLPSNRSPLDGDFSVTWEIR